MRPVVAPLIPSIRRIQRHHRTAKEILIPEILRRRAQAANPQKGLGKKPEDMLQWIEDESSGEDLRPERNVDRQLGLCFGATDGTTNLIVNVIYDLAARWSQYGPELRCEIEESLREDGGAVRQSTVNRLSKLDSFMKESQRLNPLSARSYPIVNPFTVFIVSSETTQLNRLFSCNCSVLQAQAHDLTHTIGWGFSSPGNYDFYGFWTDGSIFKIPFTTG